MLGGGHEHAVSLEDTAPVREVDRWHVDLLVADVVPHVELGPVGEREDPDVLPLVVPPVVEVPQLRALALGVPLAELVAEAEDSLLGPGLLLVPARPAEDGVVAPLGDRAQQRRRLQPVAGRSGSGVLHRPAGVDVVLHLGHHELDPEGRHVAVPELEHLFEVAPGVDVEHRERHGCRPEGLGGQVQHDDGVLAPREHQRGALELGRHLPEDVDGLRLQGAHVRQPIVARAGLRRTVLTAGTRHHAPCRQRTPPFLSSVDPEEEFTRSPPRRPSRAPLSPSRRPRSGSRRRPRPSGSHRASWRRWRSRRDPR